MADNVPTSPRGMSLTLWTVAAALVVGTAGAIWLGTRSTGSERVVVTVRALAPFHTVGASDVNVREVPRSAIPPGAIRSPAAVRGHYVLRSLGAGKVVVKQAVGPPEAAADRVVVPLPVTGGSAAGIRNGALVDVLIAPQGEHGRAVVMRRVLVVDQQKTTAGGSLVFLAIPRHRERKLASVAGRGLTILVDVPGDRPGTGTTRAKSPPGHSLTSAMSGNWEAARP